MSRLDSRARTLTAWLVAIAASVSLAAPVAGAALGKDQQRCLNEMNRGGARVAEQMSRVAAVCVRAAAGGHGAGAPRRSAGTCMQRDARSGVAARVRRLLNLETRACTAPAEGLPAFGYTSAAAVITAARAATTGVVEDLLGSQLDAAIVSRTSDAQGARCQAAVVRRTGRLFDALWTEALAAKWNALRGTDRLTGGKPPEPVVTAIELAREIVAHVQADRRGTLAAASDRLRAAMQLHCQDTRTVLGAMFPSVCRRAPSLAELAACAEQIARARFYRSLAAFDGLAIDCDLTDDGTTDLSCATPALEQHVLDRVGYGPDAFSRTRIHQLGVKAYIREQLHPELIPDDALETMLAQFPSLAMSFHELRVHYPNVGGPGQLRSGDILKEMQRAKILRAVASRRQLQEVLVDFWFNHFNVVSTDRRDFDISPYERIAIRPYVLGRFKDLLTAVARSPAMGDYLDNRWNKVDGINENYARELLELHTVGLDGGFSEADVVEVARCFTGWKENYDAPDGFEFREDWHDESAKTVMGTLHLAANGGYQDGAALIEFLSARPATATLISRKLVTRFVSDNPPLSLVAAAARTFLATDGDLRAVMETILLSPEFLTDPANRRSKVKRPLRLLASLARATDSDPAALDLDRMRRRIRELGEDLYTAAPPTGYPDVSSFWTSAGTMLLRFNAIELVARRAEGYSFEYPVTGGGSSEVVDALIAKLFAAGISDATRDTAIAFLGALTEPDTTKRTEQAAAVLLSSPEFLLH